MFIVYWSKFHGDGRMTFETELFPRGRKSIGLFPNESQWIVPGTVDPRDD